MTDVWQPVVLAVRLQPADGGGGRTQAQHMTYDITGRLTSTWTLVVKPSPTVRPTRADGARQDGNSTSWPSGVRHRDRWCWHARQSIRWVDGEAYINQVRRERAGSGDPDVGDDPTGRGL